MKRRVRWLGLMCMVGLLLGAAVPTLAAPPVTGGIYTTTAGCANVNANIYPTIESVYLSGGPIDEVNQELAPNGYWYFQVTTPDGELLSTDDIKERRVEVRNGKVVAYVPESGDTSQRDVKPCGGTGQVSIQVKPFKPTTNPGGEYKLWMTPVQYYQPVKKANGFANNFSQTDNFKIGTEDPPPQMCDLDESDLDLSVAYDPSGLVVPGTKVKVTYTAKNESGGTFYNVIISGVTKQSAPVTLDSGETTELDEEIEALATIDTLATVTGYASPGQGENCFVAKDAKVQIETDDPVIPTGTVIIQKVAVESGNQRWDFETDYGYKFNLGDGDDEILELPVGYKLEVWEDETSAPWYFDPNESACRTGKESANQVGDLTDAGFNVTVVEGTIVCTFVNVPDTRIIVVKKTNESADGPFEFTLTHLPGQNGLSQSQEFEDRNVVPGNPQGWGRLVGGEEYVIEEVSRKGWTLSGIACTTNYLDDEGEPNVRTDVKKARATVIPRTGETITCTFSNDKDKDIPTGGEDDKPNDPTPIPVPTPQAQPDPEPEPDSDEELPPPPPAAQTDLPRTGGTFLWHLLGGTGLTVAGGSAWLRRRRKGA